MFAQDARRTFTEAKKMLADAAKNRSGYFPVIWIGQLPESQPPRDQEAATTAAGSALRSPRPPGPQGGDRRAPPPPHPAGRRPAKGGGKGKGRIIKCLICQCPHRAVDCARRRNAGNDGNNLQMASSHVGFVDAESDEIDETN